MAAPTPLTCSVTCKKFVNDWSVYSLGRDGTGYPGHQFWSGRVSVSDPVLSFNTTCHVRTLCVCFSNSPPRFSLRGFIPMTFTATFVVPVQWQLSFSDTLIVLFFTFIVSKHSTTGSGRIMGHNSWPYSISVQKSNEKQVLVSKVHIAWVVCAAEKQQLK